MTSAPPSFGAQPNLNRSFFILDITSLTRVNLDRQSFIAFSLTASIDLVRRGWGWHRDGWRERWNPFSYAN